MWCAVSLCQGEPAGTCSSAAGWLPACMHRRWPLPCWRLRARLRGLCMLLSLPCVLGQLAPCAQPTSKQAPLTVAAGVHQLPIQIHTKRAYRPLPKELGLRQVGDNHNLPIRL